MGRNLIGMGQTLQLLPSLVGNKVIEFYTTNSSQSHAMMKLGCIHWALETVNFLIDKICSSLSCHTSTSTSTTLVIALVQGRHNMTSYQPSTCSTSQLDVRESMIGCYLRSRLEQHAWVNMTSTIKISQILTNNRLGGSSSGSLVEPK